MAVSHIVVLGLTQLVFLFAIKDVHKESSLRSNQRLSPSSYNVEVVFQLLLMHLESERPMFLTSLFMTAMVVTTSAPVVHKHLCGLFELGAVFAICGTGGSLIGVNKRLSRAAMAAFRLAGLSAVVLSACGGGGGLHEEARSSGFMASWIFKASKLRKTTSPSLNRCHSC